MERLDLFLQARPSRPRVQNPFTNEDFSNCWSSDEKYQNFRNQVHRYRGWIDDAFEEEDRNKSIQKWKRVFGKEFAKGEDVSHSTMIYGQDL